MKRQQRIRDGILLNPLVPMVTLVLLVLLTQGCGKRSVATPLNNTSDFPETRFLRAEGGGPTEMDARRQALAELSSIFESRVQSQTTSLATSSLGSDNMEHFEKTIESKIRIISWVRLEGAKIGKVWQDGAGNFHALAVLDRVDAGRNWTRDLERLDNRLRAEAIALEKVKGRLPRMAALNRIMSLSLERHGIESRLGVVNYPALSELELDMAKMTSELALIQAELRFYIDVTGKYGPLAGKVLSKALTQNGILITLDMDKADAWVMGQVELTPLSLANPKIVFVRAAGDVEVIETGSHALFAKINENLRKGHVDQNEAM
ncbi:MAG: hypothetical protein GY860_06125, partial [Desulfobacteraceae bacterium]|nr:hypothetical protein [Desulfobacteraceae bacterium]